MTDVWVCSTCHSINRQRDSRCYKCGARASTGMAGAIVDVRVETAVANRAVRGYRPAWPLALLASALILVVAALGVYLTIAAAPLIPSLKAEFAAYISGRTPTVDAALVTRVQDLVLPGLVRILLLLVAVIAFAFWLSRVVGNVPTLGGGQPGTTQVKAFVYPLIPIVNLVKVPGIVQGVLYRVDRRGGGLFMVMLAWFELAGSWVVSTLGGWALAGSMTAEIAQARTVNAAINVFETYVDRSYVLDIATSVMAAAGAVFLVILMLQIELRSAARDCEIRDAALA